MFLGLQMRRIGVICMARSASHYYGIRIHVKREWCKGCGICIVLCARKVLVLDNRGKAVVVNPAACTGCGNCEIHCPDLAIMVDRPAAEDRAPVYAGKSARLSYSGESWDDSWA